MIITCPNCETHYDVRPEAIRPSGSMMRCSNCGYTWQQSVIHSVEVREQQITVPVAAAPAPAVAAPAPAPAPVAPVAPPPPPPPPPIPEPEPEPIPEPEPEPEPTPKPEPVPEPVPASQAEGEPLSQDELDNLFGSDDAAPPSIESMIGGNIDDDEAETIEVEVDDIDPIPEGLTKPLAQDDDEIPVGRPRFKNPPPDKKTPIGMIIGIVFAVLFIGTAVTAFVAKDSLIHAMPMLKGYYEAAGLYHPEPGEGLAHQDVKARRDVKNAIDYLIVEGKVANTTDAIIHLPELKVALTNTEGKEIRVLTQKLSKEQLDPGETVAFKVEFENPPGTARSMALGFVDPNAAAEDGGGHGGGHGADPAAAHGEPAAAEHSSGH